MSINYSAYPIETVVKLMIPSSVALPTRKNNHMNTKVDNTQI